MIICGFKETIFDWIENKQILVKKGYLSCVWKNNDDVYCFMFYVLCLIKPGPHFY